MRLHTLADLIDSLTPRGAHKAIVSFERDGVAQYAYADLARRIDLVASGLMEIGIAKGDRVAVLAPNQPSWIIAALASIRAGAVVVPIDVQLPDDTLSHVLRDSQPQVVFTVHAQRDRIHNSGAAPQNIFFLDEDMGEASSQLHSVAQVPAVAAEDTAVLFYTSGTTGPPKGVPLTHGNIVHQLNVLRDINLVRRGDRLLLPLPFHHVYPFVMGILAPLAMGVPIVLPRALTGPQLARAAHDGKATVIVGVPRLFDALLDGMNREAASRGGIRAISFRVAFNVSNLSRRFLGLPIGRFLLAPVRKRIGLRIRMLTSGGAALRPKIAHRLRALGWDVATGYGLTETAPLLTLNYPGRSRLNSAGGPIPGVELRIDSAAVEPEKSDGKVSPIARKRGEGEVLARGPNVFAGYRNLPEQNHEAFTGDGWFRTGDLGWIDRSEFLHLTGRASTMIVTEGGKHVQPDDVEEVYQRHPAIREIGILQREGRLVAIVVPGKSESRGSSSSGVRQALEEQGRHLRPYERVSDFAVTTEALPRTRLGKVQHHALEELFDRAKAGKERKKRAGPLSPGDMSAEDQELLRDPSAGAVWDWLSERFAENQVTPDTNLRMELDIDSMEWMNLTLELGQRTGLELEEDAIGRIETVRDLLREASAASVGQGARIDEVLDDPESFLDKEQKHWLSPLSRGQAALARWIYATNRVFMRVCFRVHAVGAEQLPKKGSIVIASNHASYLDPFAIASVLDPVRRRKTCWAGWTGAAFRGPLTRAVSRLGKVVPVDPERAALASLALAAAILKRGDSLVWFPEGARSKDGRLHELRPGIGLLLEHQPTIVVPAYIKGSHKALPVGAALPRPVRIRILFGEPATPEELEREGKGSKRDERITSGLQQRLKELARKK